MTQKFKFGDRVKYKMLGECVVINSSEHFCYVMNEKGDYDTTANPEEIELIPHPDMERLDWIEETFGNNEMLILKTGIGRTYRQAIDKAMQQEQTK